jgi:hypothetical protein
MRNDLYLYLEPFSLPVAAPGKGSKLFEVLVVGVGVGPIQEKACVAVFPVTRGDRLGQTQLAATPLHK